MTATEVPTRTPLRRVLRGTGLVLVLVGVSILGYVGWEYLGTTWVSQRQQHRIIDATERVWAGGEVPVKDAELAQGVVALVRIPALGKDYVVPAHPGTDDATLSKGFGVFDSSPRPGGKGNFAMAGHRITHGEPLRGMPNLTAGDKVLVQTRDTTYTYVLDTDGDAMTVDIDATWVVDDSPVDPRTGRDVASEIGSRRLLTLVTCAELFHTDTRLVAFGHLVSEEPVR